MYLKICDQKSSVNHSANHSANHSVNRSIPCYTSFLSIQRAWHWKRNIGTWLRFVRRATRTTITCDIYEVFEQLKRYRRSRHGRMPFSCNSTMVFPTRNCCRRARSFTKGRGRGKKKRKARGVRALPGNRGRQETHCWVVSAIECEPRATNRRRIGGRETTRPTIFEDGGHRCCRRMMEENDT